MTYSLLSCVDVDIAYAQGFVDFCKALNIPVEIRTLNGSPVYGESSEQELNEVAGVYILVSDSYLKTSMDDAGEIERLLEVAKDRKSYLYVLRYKFPEIEGHALEKIPFSSVAGNVGDNLHEFAKIVKTRYGIMLEQYEKRLSMKHSNNASKTKFEAMPETSGCLFLPEELDIYINKITADAFIFHGKHINYDTINYLELDHLEKHIIVHMIDGRKLDLGVKIQWLVLPYLREAVRVQIVRTKDGEAECGSDYPLKHSNRKFRIEKQRSYSETIESAISELDKPNSLLNKFKKRFKSFR